MNAICKAFGHKWEYLSGDGFTGKKVAVRKCQRCGRVEARSRDTLGAWCWRPARPVEEARRFDDGREFERKAVRKHEA